MTMSQYGNKSPLTDVVIDIETVCKPVSQGDIDAYMQEYTPPGNYKTEDAIARHKLKTEAEAVDKITNDRRFSLGGKRMISCSLGKVHEHDGVTDIQSWAGEDLSLITNGIVSYLNRFVNGYRLIGWNLKKFDLPEVAKSFKFTGVKPKIKPTKWDIIDLCDHPFRMQKLKDVATALNIEIMGVDGSMVDKLYRDGDWDTIRAYNEDDVRITGEVYLATSTIFTF